MTESADSLQAPPLAAPIFACGLDCVLGLDVSLDWIVPLGLDCALGLIPRLSQNHAPKITQARFLLAFTLLAYPGDS